VSAPGRGTVWVRWPQRSRGNSTRDFPVNPPVLRERSQSLTHTAARGRLARDSTRLGDGRRVLAAIPQCVNSG